MAFVKTGDSQPILTTFDIPNRKRTFNEDGEVVYADIEEDATILDVINESVIEEDKKDN